MMLSVVVPVRNEADYIRPCLRALLAQSAELADIVVVDNGSTDDTTRLAAELAADHPVIRVIAEPRPGLIAARNAGVDAAKGEVVARIDADTRVEPGWAAAIQDYFADDAHAQVGAVSGLVHTYDSPFSGLRARFLARQVRNGVLGGGRHSGMLLGANMAVRREAWDAVRDKLSTRSDIFEDADLAMCLEETGWWAVELDTMWAAISARRALADPVAYARYLAGSPKALRLHGLRGVRPCARIALMYLETWLAHTLAWPIFLVWKALGWSRSRTFVHAPKFRERR